MQTKDLGAVEADNEALQLLLVHGKRAGLDRQHAVAGETQHVLTTDPKPHQRLPRNDGPGFGLLDGNVCVRVFPTSISVFQATLLALLSVNRSSFESRSYTKQLAFSSTTASLRRLQWKRDGVSGHSSMQITGRHYAPKPSRV